MWRPRANGVLSSDLSARFWLDIHGLPLHLWNLATFSRIGKACGGFLRVDHRILSLSDFRVARIQVVETCLDHIPLSVRIPNGNKEVTVVIFVLLEFCESNSGDLLHLRSPSSGVGEKFQNLSSLPQAVPETEVKEQGLSKRAEKEDQTVRLVGVGGLVSDFVRPTGEARKEYTRRKRLRGLAFCVGRSVEKDSWSDQSESEGSFVIKRLEDSRWFPSKSCANGPLGLQSSGLAMASIAEVCGGWRLGSSSNSSKASKDVCWGSRALLKRSGSDSLIGKEQQHPEVGRVEAVAPSAVVEQTVGSSCKGKASCLRTLSFYLLESPGILEGEEDHSTSGLRAGSVKLTSLSGRASSGKVDLALADSLLSSAPPAAWDFGHSRCREVAGDPSPIGLIADRSPPVVVEQKGAKLGSVGDPRSGINDLVRGEPEDDGVGLGCQGLRWYAKRLRIDEDGDVADEFLEEILLETSSSTEDHRPLPRFEVKYRTRPAKVRNQVTALDGKLHHSVEYQGKLQWV
ncbi:hypothetical protein HHK36_028177 [Tetracentron sinense]|uniref:DUF4283 domain-containing protein n=1 Tax=Tetracentron sinense TaxID=13715 RepID=A0A834YIR9_TETSI|nr:hypothetical protein HHK36_028177 [Tetracentron sinense]